MCPHDTQQMTDEMTMWSLDSQQWAEVRDEMIRMLDQAPACHRFIWDLAPHYNITQLSIHQHHGTSLLPSVHLTYLEPNQSGGKSVVD